MHASAPATTESTLPSGDDALSLFHPAVSAWFKRAFGTPTEPQRRGWPEIARGMHTLILAPTGGGKTLSAFLSGIDQLVRQAVAGSLQEQTQLIYVSPLKALSNDIHKNLEQPLCGIQKELAFMGISCQPLRASVRTGDTPASERGKMLKHPPHILVTTPESLFILLNTESGRRLLGTAKSVIVDEIHALLGDKRGAHLALTLQRLDALCERQLTRIGLSATQRPVERVARFLVGSEHAENACRIVDCGHSRKRDLSIELPGSPLSAVMAAEVWEELHQRLCELIEQHKTSLIFVNTRRLAERLTRHLSEALGQDAVTSHHGSLSKEQRLSAEQRLKQGTLKALVATASLELGIDIGDVELVCQVGMVRSISTFLQRVGRSGHRLSAIPKGRLFPLSRDELVEAVALLEAIERAELDQVEVPTGPLDILAQQITAAAAAGPWHEADLFHRFRGAYPYRDLSWQQFDKVVRMLAEGFSTRRGRRGARVHYDGVNHQIRGRKGARLIVNTSGGAIPETADYEVIEEPSGLRVGSVNEDFAIESMAGDIFQLGNVSWQIQRVEPGRVRVTNARGKPPTIPFWLGEAPARSAELSQAVSRLRKRVATKLEAAESDGVDRQSALERARQAVLREAPVGSEVARQLVEYLGSAYFALGAMPTHDTLVLERFFDESGGMQLVLHSPRGARLNRAFGLALRKRFCQTFNFELQAAANEDAIVISLGPVHSFELKEVFHYLNSQTARDVLTQALLDAPMFMTRWRWNATRSLAVLRFRNGKKVPPRFQRMDADDLLSVVFPESTACFENLPGRRELNDHPLVVQTVEDCLNEAMDIERFEALLREIEAKTLTLLARDVTEPSPLAQEILNARPYAFLDDAPLEERRTQAVLGRSWLDPETVSELGALDPDAIARVRSEAFAEADSPDELHDALVVMGFLTEKEGIEAGFGELFTALTEARRATTVTFARHRLWVAAERLPQVSLVFDQHERSPEIKPPENALESPDRETARVELIRGRLEGLGPVTLERICADLHQPRAAVEQALTTLQSEGFVLKGQFETGAGEQWCERRLLARIHRYTLKRLRQEIEPVTALEFLRFLQRFQHLTPDTQLQGDSGLLRVVEQLEGLELPAAAWEKHILPARIGHYSSALLDTLCLSGQVTWSRLQVPKATIGSRRAAVPVKATPIALVLRSSHDLWHAGDTAADSDPPALSSVSRRVFELLKTRGAMFFADLARAIGGLRLELEGALGELVAQGLVTSDSFAGLRAFTTTRPPKNHPRRRSAPARDPFELAGRWSAVQGGTTSSDDRSAFLEHYARVLLRRYGVVFRSLMQRESRNLPWRDLLRVYRRLEARGEIRGGRFVAGFTGEQYALPEAVAELRATRRLSKSADPAVLSLSAVDPLNLIGVITPGERVPALSGNRVLFVGETPVATRVGGETRFLVEDLEPHRRAELQSALIRTG